jgi:hypothetical protein
MATKKAKAKTPEKVAAVVEAPTEEPTAKPKYAENDNSIDARMWRLLQDHKRMGSR